MSRRITVWASVATLAAGCSGSLMGLFSPSCRYQLNIFNRTHENFYNVCVWFGPKLDDNQFGPNVATSMGGLRAGFIAGDYPLRREVPDEATVAWVVDVDGKSNGMNPPPNHPRKQATVKLASIVPRCPNEDSVYLIIHEDGTVSAAMCKHDDVERAVELTISSLRYDKEDNANRRRALKDFVAGQRKKGREVGVQEGRAIYKEMTGKDMD